MALLYSYGCPACGEIDSFTRADTVTCRCGATAKRRYRIHVDRQSLKESGRWDPVVGCYVSGDAEFRSKLAEGQAAESERLGMEVKLATCDARDNEALAELHGWPDREKDLEPTVLAPKRKKKVSA